MQVTLEFDDKHAERIQKAFANGNSVTLEQCMEKTILVAVGACELQVFKAAQQAVIDRAVDAQVKQLNEEFGLLAFKGR